MSSIAAEQPQPLRTFRARTSWGYVVAGACLLTLLCVAAVQPFAGPAPAQDAAIAGPAPVTPKLAALAQSDPGRRVEVIARLEPGAPTEAARSLVRAAGGHAGEPIGLINGFSARLDARDAQRLALQPGVVAVSLNGATKPQGAGLKPNQLETSFNQSVKSPRVWKHATGEGVGVAVIDTGVAGGLADFRGADGASRVVASAVTHPDATTAEDAYGHGTHVAGLIAGDSSRRAAGDPLRGRYAGTAPGAHLISIKASDDHGDSTVLDVIYGIEFAVEHRDEFDIRVLNLSLESTVAESYRTDPLAAAVEAAWFKGIVVVAAAGNRGTDADAVDYAPGNDPYVISVGAVDDQGTKQVKDDLRTDWSSRGTTQDGHAKPELYAPGARMVSNLAPDSDFASMCPDCVSGDGQYIRAGGTSMSAPVVAGVVATLLEEHPSWTPDQVKGALVNNLRGLPGGGHELDAFGAFTASKRELTSNEGLEPSEIVDPATGEVAWDRSRWSRSRWSRSRWSRSRWSTATGTLSPSWAGASYVCDCEMVDPETGEVDPT
ncbi:MAG: S8 family serine peptidase, partial [Solirubrobacterales bacterium]